MQTKAALWDSLIANKNTLMIQSLGSNCSYMQNDIPNMASLDKYCALEDTTKQPHTQAFPPSSFVITYNQKLDGWKAREQG